MESGPSRVNAPLEGPVTVIPRSLSQAGTGNRDFGLWTRTRTRNLKQLEQRRVRVTVPLRSRSAGLTGSRAEESQ